MSPAPGVVLDADFLSAFLKIDRLPIVKSFYRVEGLFVPPAVYREVSLTDLLPRLTSIPWIHVQPPDVTQAQTLWQDEDFARLGPGEQEAIALSIELGEAVLLMNDNKARRVAAHLGVEVLNIPSFLMACKVSGVASRTEILDLVTALEERDRIVMDSEKTSESYSSLELH